MESTTERIASPLKVFFRVSALLVAMALVGVMATASGAAEGDTTIVSVDSSGNVAEGSSGWGDNKGSYSPSISADGRFVAFYSRASNLVANDTNETYDVFVHNLQTGITKRVSIDSLGRQGNSYSWNASISSDGRFVAFESGASDLVANDSNDHEDIFVRDRQTGTTERMSVDSLGNQANTGSRTPSISSNGRFVAFVSGASNLVADDTNDAYDVFVRDRQTGTTERMNVDSSENQTNGSYYSRNDEPSSISADGRYVAFHSRASNLVPNDTNTYWDVFVRDRQTGTTKRVNVDSSENQVNSGSDLPSISSDGRFVAFSSNATNLVEGDTNGTSDVFVRDLQTGTTERVSVDSSGKQGSYSDHPSISPDGRFVAFASGGSDLVANDTNGTSDVFVHDRQMGITELVSVDSSGKQGNSYSDHPSISSDGSFVAFKSLADNFVPNDTNDWPDVFAHELNTTAPNVTRVVPTEGATDVALKADVVATFSERMTKSTLTKATFKLYKLVRNPDDTTTAKQVENVTVTPSPDGLKATLNPFGGTDGLLEKNARYKAVVSTGTLDVFGNRLDQNRSVSGNQPKVWFFKTRS